ncbi:MAG: deoxyuridine 5'-triphosphate nucleotidohydrolase [Lachnospiraceae bacterium]|nr:deoxyuridine 5'-triphosphate nucleotidohydrolase [Lachnospiraceae bacterium]
MERIAKFETISRARFIQDFTDTFPDMTVENAEKAYASLSLPVRATKGSAGYDFRSTRDFTLAPGESIKIPTGIRVRMREDHCLMIFPRSGLGFKYRLQMNNTVGIIDSDYYNSDNEGHIFIKITNDSKEGRVVTLKAGDAFAQGIFMCFGITEDDEVFAERNGGLGSTSK